MVIVPSAGTCLDRLTREARSVVKESGDQKLRCISTRTTPWPRRSRQIENVGNLVIVPSANRTDKGNDTQQGPIEPQ